MVNSQNLKASVSFVGDGTTNKFYFGFDYINKQFVKVQIGNEGQSLTYPSDYTVDDRSVVLKDTPAVGVAIRVYRETSSDRIVEWADGAFIKASQMTLENLQQLHLIEEAQDYPILNSLSKYPDGVNFNALGHRIINVGDPKDPQNVVTKHYMENVQGGFVKKNTELVNEATKQASAAKSSQTAAKSSESNAATYASKANTSNISAKNWAMSVSSPDNAEDTKSKTGKTQSSRSWALQAEESVNNINFYMFNILKRGTRYSVGDIAYTPLLKSYLYLECVTAGTTQSSNPSFSGKVENSLVNDGTVVWKVRKVTPQAYVDSNFLPLSGGVLTGSLGINGVNQGITIQEKSMLATSSSSERFTDLLSHSDKNNNRFFFLRSGVKQDNDKYVELSMVDRNNNPAEGISLYYDNSRGEVSVNIYGKEIKTLFYPYYSIQRTDGGFTRFDGLQMFYTWLKAGATYTYPKPFSDIPRVFVQYLTGSNAPQFQNNSKTSFTNVGSNDCYLLAIGKGV
jgi:hypothetical protein